MTIVVGLDPGVQTGYAEWNSVASKLQVVTTFKIHEAMAALELVKPSLVIFEDARLRQWFGNAGREKLQGAGSVKRDSKIWQDYLTDLDIPFVMKRPASGATKWTAERFNTTTKWEGRTTEHGRDAALLVFGLNPRMIEGLIASGGQHGGRQGNRKAG